MKIKGCQSTNLYQANKLAWQAFKCMRPFLVDLEPLIETYDIRQAFKHVHENCTCLVHKFPNQYT